MRGRMALLWQMTGNRRQTQQEHLTFLCVCAVGVFGSEHQMPRKKTLVYRLKEEWTTTSERDWTKDFDRVVTDWRGNWAWTWSDSFRSLCVPFLLCRCRQDTCHRRGFREKGNSLSSFCVLLWREGVLVSTVHLRDRHQVSLSHLVMKEREETEDKRKLKTCFWGS